MFTVAGCASTPPPMALADADDPPPAPAVKEIALVDGAGSRAETYQGVLGESRRRLKTGERLAAVFTGQADAPATLRVDNSLFRVEAVAVGFAARMTYVLDTTITVAGKATAIHADGSDTVVFGLAGAMRRAVDGAIASTAEQARRLLPMTPTRSIADRLRELDRLLRDGAISVEEHRVKREEILRAL